MIWLTALWVFLSLPFCLLVGRLFRDAAALESGLRDASQRMASTRQGRHVRQRHFAARPGS